MRWAEWIDVGRMDDLGRLDTPLHRLDARAKAVTVIAYIACVMSYPRYEVVALAPLALFPIVMSSLGRVPWGFLLRRMLVAAPFVLAVAIFNPLLDRAPVTTLGQVGISGGWLSFVSIMLRFALTVSAALALIACTGIYDLCSGMERLGLPGIFASQILFLHRYLWVLGDEAQRLARGLEVRGFGPRVLRLRVYGSLLGHMLLRSVSRAERIYCAMVARGFDGTIRTQRPGRFHWADAAFVCGWGGYFAVSRAWNLSGLLGDWLLRVAR